MVVKFEVTAEVVVSVAAWTVVALMATLEKVALVQLMGKPVAVFNDVIYAVPRLDEDVDVMFSVIIEVAVDVPACTVVPFMATLDKVVPIQSMGKPVAVLRAVI